MIAFRHAETESETQVQIIDTAKSAGAAVVWEQERAGMRVPKLDSGERFPPRKEEGS